MKEKKSQVTIHINTSPVTENSPNVYWTEIFNEILWYFYMSHHIKDCDDDDTDNNILL